MYLFQIIFKKEDGKTNQSSYWLSSPCALFSAQTGAVHYRMRYVIAGSVDGDILQSGSGMGDCIANALRPVIVLNSNIQFGEKNSSGAFTLVEI